MGVMIGGRFGAVPLPANGRLPCGCLATAWEGVVYYNPKCRSHSPPTKDKPAYDGCGADNGPSLTERDVAEKARVLLAREE